MWNAGIDLHRRTAVVAMVDDKSQRVRPRAFKCSRPREIVEFFVAHRPFRAVIEASCAYRWLYDLLAPHGEVVLAHPLLLKSIWNTRAKTDKKDAEALTDIHGIGLYSALLIIAEITWKRLRDWHGESSAA